MLKKFKKVKDKEEIKEPEGLDAVRLRKLLFLSKEQTYNVFTQEQWGKIDFRCLTLMKIKYLKAACLNRKLDHKGSKKQLVERLIDSFDGQRQAEKREQELELIELELQKDALGSVWSFGTGESGQLGHGTTESIAQATQIKSLRGVGVIQVFAGFDSDISFALTKKGDVYVWGNKYGPTGLERNENLELLYEETLGFLLEETSDHKDPEEVNRFDVVNEKDYYAKDDMFLSNMDNDGKVDDEDKDPIDTNVEEKKDNNDKEIENEEGNLNKNNSTNILHPVKVKKLCGEMIHSIQVGRIHCGARTYTGDVFTWGYNDHGQLGNEPFHLLSEEQKRRSKTRHGCDSYSPEIWNVTIPEDYVIKDISVGTCHTMVLTDRGKLLSFGAEFHTGEPSSISRSLSQCYVEQVSCGATHAGLITERGLVYTWGSGDGGRLGHGNNTSHCVPVLVETLKNEIVLQILCSTWHTLALILIPPLIKGGLVYTWGTGRLGQLGQGSKQVSLLPGVVQDLLMTHVFVRKMFTGMYHNAVLTAENEVFTWGSNINGCLGRPKELDGLEEDFCVVPGRVEGIKDFVGPICSVACGRNYTLIATKPYLGPNRKEMEKIKKEEEEIRLIIEEEEKKMEDMEEADE